MSELLKPPIILFGNYRSGTTITQKLIELHPSVVSWYEPRTLWRYADPGRRHDEFYAIDATENVTRYIRSRFAKYQANHENQRIIENTPSNVLRVPYVHAIFPEATYLYITRNPLSCISSMELQWQGKKTWGGLVRTLKDTPTTQIHHYAADFIEYVVMRRIIKSKYMSVYGPKYSEIKADLKIYDEITVMARQWALCSRRAREELAKLGGGRVLSFRYEDLVEKPEFCLRQIYDHCDLACDDEIMRKAKDMIDPGRQEKWLRLDQQQLKAVIPHIQEEMAACGYEIPLALR